jgi:hypothetical protein
MQWIEVPGVAKESFALSSLFLGERSATTDSKGDSKGPQSIRVDVDHRFARSSVLRFQTYVYNAVGDSTEPDVLIEVRILRGLAGVKVLPGNRVPNEAAPDKNSLPYWSEVSLEELSPGNYTLQVEATERIKNRKAQQRTNFTVE